MSFSKMKKKRSNIEDLAKKLESQGKKSYDKDERFWYPKRDDNGNGYAIIRFLPPKDGETSSFVQTFRHGFQAKNGWYIEDCPTTIGEDCPVCKANGELYTSLGKEGASRIVSGPNGRKRQMSYVANIYVVSDPETPENEGKNFLFKFGAKIMDKIKLAVKPEFPDETPIDPFDLWDGANFTLKIRKVDGNVNYDSSSFGDSVQLLESDKEMEAIYNAEYSLDEIIGKDKYKPYKELESRFNRVTGEGDAGDADEGGFLGKSHDPVKAEVTEMKPQETSEEDKDTLKFFEGLVEEG